MPFFKKSTSSKIPDVGPPPQSNYGQPQQQQPSSAPGYGHAYGQQGQQGQQAGYGHGYNQQSAYDQRYGQGNPAYNQHQQYHNQQPPHQHNYGQPTSQSYSNTKPNYAPSVTESALDQEYGVGAGGSGNHGGGGGGYGTADQQEQQEELDPEEEEIQAIKQQMRFAKQDSLHSTREAIRLARQAEETATNSIQRLGDQSEKLANTEHNFNLAKAASARADDNARDIVKLNRSIFIPAVTMDKKGKRMAEEARIINRHIEEREQRERLREEAARARARVDEAVTENQKSASRFARDRFGLDRFGGGGGGGSKSNAPDVNSPAARMAQRARYQFEASASDDEIEDELDANLDEISAITGRLNKMGRAMGQELEEQNSRIRRMTDKASHVDTKIYSSTQKLQNIK